MITRAHLIDVLFVIAPHPLLLDIAGPAEAFQLANLHRGRRGLPPRFRLRFAGPASSPATSVGVRLADLEPLPQRLAATTWVVLVGQPTVHTIRVTPPVAATARWLHQMLRDCRRTRRTACWRSARARCWRRGRASSGAAAAPPITSCCPRSAPSRRGPM